VRREGLKRDVQEEVNPGAQRSLVPRGSVHSPMDQPSHHRAQRDPGKREVVLKGHGLGRNNIRYRASSYEKGKTGRSGVQVPTGPNRNFPWGAPRAPQSGKNSKIPLRTLQRQRRTPARLQIVSIAKDRTAANAGRDTTGRTAWFITVNAGTKKRV